MLEIANQCANFAHTTTRLYKKSKSMDKKVLIVGSGGGGLMAAKIAELQAQNPDMEVVTIEEAKERGLSQTFEIKAQPLLDERHYFKPPPTRAERRKQERMNKKKR